MKVSSDIVAKYALPACHSETLIDLAKDAELLGSAIGPSFRRSEKLHDRAIGRFNREEIDVTDFAE